MAQYSFADYSAQATNKAANATNGGSRVSYFGLKNDNDYAVVRFIYQKPEQFDIISVHNVVIDGRNRKVNCLRTPHDAIQACPLCAASNQAVTKFFVKLIEYVVDPTNGSIIATPKVWERPARFAQDLAKKCEIYGNLSNNVFIVTRHGKPKDQQTTYSIDFAPSEIYKPDLYPADFSAFETYKFSSYVVLDKTYAELTEMVGATASAQPVPTAAPSYVNAPVQSVASSAQTIPSTAIPAGPVTHPVYTAPVSQPTFTAPQQPQQTAPVTGQKRYF